MRLLSALLIALAIALAPVIWHYTEGRFTPPLPPVADNSKIETQLAVLRDQVTQLQNRVDGLDARTSLGLLAAARPEAVQNKPTVSDSLKDSFAQVVLIAGPQKVNQGLTVAPPSFLSELYARIKTSGSLCVRRIRGSDSAASAHSYGLAVDINVDGVLDNFADGRTQLGLILMSDYFKKEGWIWGAGFSREDSMHFKVSREKLEQWRRLGEL